MSPLLILITAVFAAIFLIVRLRLNPFLALIGSGMLVGVMAPGVPLDTVMKELGVRFGSVAGSIAISIVAAAIVGQCLMESGAADKITRRFVAWLGEKHASLSMVACGYVLAVPVFFDTVFYLLVPLARAMSIRRGGRNFVLYALAISAGGSTTHVFVPPTPGPIAMSATLGVDLGMTILVGLGVALPSSLVGWLYCVWIDRRLALPIREAPGLSLAALEEVSKRPEEDLPGFWASMVPILLPVILITGNTVTEAVAKGTGLARGFAFVGHPSFALTASAISGLWILSRHRRLTLQQLSKPIETAVASAGTIILITAAGGAFGGMLVLAGVGDALGALAQSMGLSLIWMGFFLAILFKVAQGSATVTMITVSSILAPLVLKSPPPYNPVYLVMAVGAGSLIGVWMNDSGFWVYRTMTGLNEVESLKTKSALMAIMGAVAILITVLLAQLFPLHSK